jgi:hypothetical protein
MADVLKATYTNIKPVITRSTVQIILEMPMEAMTDIVNLLGPPMPASEVWVAVARLRPEVVQQPAMIEAPDEDKPPKPLSQVSAILCNIVAFRRFLHEHHGLEVVPTVDEAADWVREHCGVKSRREFDTDDAAAANFISLRSTYDAWMRCAA